MNILFKDFNYYRCEMKEKILTITAKEFNWDFVRGSGKGGQKRNKTCSAVRCTHKESGASAWCENGRSQLHNRQKAFEKCCKSDKFQKWLRIAIAKITGELAKIDDEVDRLMDEKYLKIETF